jgi:hypothetical protein
MSTAEVFVDIDKAFHKTGYLSLLYKLSKLKISINVIKLISYFSPKILSRTNVNCLCQGNKADVIQGSTRQRGCYIRTMTTNVLLQK